ncbi:MAG: hypothetical protein E7A62_00440 [Actinomycetaceae bacterium]|nr:hypothetical protein [Actinomycetaceae bacterium]MDU0969445.1 hypothetical protein [Actinomycetaceae bacterium]
MSDTTWWIVIVVVVVALAAIVAWRQAVRLDRLHRQVLQARASLDALLIRRAHAAIALASSDLLDPASAMLIAKAAQDCLDAGPALTADAMQPERLYSMDDAAMTQSSQPRQACESILTQVLRQTLTRDVREQLDRDPRGRELLGQLTRAHQQVTYARRFHNDHVARARALRSHPSVRFLRLAGHAALPDAVDIDDALVV